MHTLRLTAASLLLAVSTAAQQSLITQFGANPGGQIGHLVASAGDMDGDMLPDLLIGGLGVGTNIVQIVSPANGPLQTISSAGTPFIAVQTLFSNDDMNGDGVRDVVVDRGLALRAYSGATGGFLWQTSNLTIYKAVPVGDLNGDMRGDIAVIVDASGPHLWTLNGATGAPLSTGPSVAGGVAELGLVGDVNGDGEPEVAVRVPTGVRVISPSTMTVRITVSMVANSGTAFSGGDVNGDGRPELLIEESDDVMRAYDTQNGSLVRAFDGSVDNEFAVVGDLNADGASDLALLIQSPSSGRRVEFVSGLTGSMLGLWNGSVQVGLQRLAAVGDANGDGYPDLLLGDASANVDPSLPSSSDTGAWQLISGKVLATMESKPVQCTQGPFAPELGITRPILGQNMSIVGRDSPAGAVGFLVFSPQPAFATNLGVVGCDAWFDLDNGVLLGTTTTVDWQLPLPLPMIPQLAGYRIALQAYYVPTFAPLGFDISNGVWATLGY